MQLLMSAVVIVVSAATYIIILGLHERTGGKKKDRIMGTMRHTIRWLKSLLGIAIEMSLYVKFVFSQLSFMELLLGFCLLRVAWYCIRKDNAISDSDTGTPYAD